MQAVEKESKGAGGIDRAAQPPDEYMRSVFSRTLWESLPPVGYGLSLLYVLFAISHPFVLGGRAKPLVALALVTSATTAIIAYAIGRREPRIEVDNLLAMVFVCLVLLNSTVHMLLAMDPKQTTNFILLIVGVGSFYISARGLFFSIGLVVAVWVMAFLSIRSAELVHYSFAIFSACVISFLARYVRMRALIQAIRARWKQEQHLALLRAADTQLLKANLELESRVRARTAELVQEIEKRRAMERSAFEAEKLATTGRLAATIAHEINNPLEAVGNLIYLIQSDSRLPLDAREQARMAQQELGRVSHIAKQTLSFYRDSGQPTSFSVNSALEDVLEMYRPKARSRSLQLRLLARDGDISVQGYLGEFRQVASNLLLNAIDASPAGSEILIRVKGTNADGQPGVRVTFADRGVGIQKHLHAKLFQPFFTTKEQRGTGLGLWVALGIVTRHGGNIQVASSTRPERHGTCVSVWLPLESTETPYKRRRFEAEPVAKPVNLIAKSEGSRAV
ncbi:MAG: sensor histidine kinase [Acidobacteriaceae bacterium]